MATKRVKAEEVDIEKVFITGSSKIVTEKELKKYEIPQTKQVETENTFIGGRVINPPYDLGKLMSWLHTSVIHNSCVHTKVGDTVGIGWGLREIEGKGIKPTEDEYNKLFEFFSKVNTDENITSVNEKVGLDYEACGNGYYEVARHLKKEDGIKAIFHISAPTLRLSHDKTKWIQRVGHKKVYFKPWGEEKELNRRTGRYSKTVGNPEDVANEIIHVKQYTHKSSIYGLPEWLPAIFQMYGEQKEKEYNLDFFTNYGVPAYAVIIKGMKLNDDLKLTIKKYFETEIKNDPHRTMIFTPPSGAEIHFEKLSVETKEASFRVYRRDNRDDILTAHRVPPYRAGIVVEGKLGGSVAEDVDRIYLDSVINPRQKQLAWIFTEKIIKEGFDINSYEFYFEDIDIRDKKVQSEIDKTYFNMGARTPNEILVSQGKDPYPGGDLYYAPQGLIPVGSPEVKLSKVKVDEEDEEIDDSDFDDGKEEDIEEKKKEKKK